MDLLAEKLGVDAANISNLELSLFDTNVWVPFLRRGVFT